MTKAKKYYILDGRFITDAKSISTNNRSFRYGDGFFESIKIINGKIAFWDFHYKRILSTINLLNYDIPAKFEISLIAGIKELLLKNNIFEGARTRLHIYRKDGGLYTPKSNEISYLIETENSDNFYPLNKSGLNIGIFNKLCKANNILSNYKLSGATIYVLAAGFCKSSEFDEVLLLNHNRRIAEASSSNFYIIKDNKILTPSLSELALNGTIRNVLLSDDFASNIKKLNLEIIEGEISLEDLKDADEAFISNAISGIKWIKSFEDKEYKNDIVFELSKILNKYVNNHLN